MKRKVIIIFAVLFLSGAGMFIQPGKALSHDISVSFGIGMIAPPPPPAFVSVSPPALYAVPGTSVYHVPQIERQMYFYSGNWYRLHDGYWYRASYYNGPWAYLAPPSVPAAFINLSPRYYRVPPREAYRVRWEPSRHRDPWQYRSYGRSGDWNDHRDSHDRHDNRGGRGFDNGRNWDHDRSGKRWY